MDIADARSLLQSREALRRTGWTDRRIDLALADGSLHRVDHARYVDAGTWRAAYAEGRHLLRLVAAHERSRGGWVAASHVSAAVAHGLPLYRVEPHRVHISGVRSDGRVARSEPLVARHELAVPTGDVVVLGGIPCTALERTIADVIRHLPEDAGLAVVDAALGKRCWDRRAGTYDQDAHDRLISEVHRRLPVGGRGVKRARLVLDLADGRAESPGESASRWSLVQLGFARPRLQVPVPGPNGQHYRVDFGLDDVHAWGEFDGAGKYTDPAMLGPDSHTASALLKEKMREDWIRGTTNRKLPRWGYDDIRTLGTFARRLAQFHVLPPR